MPATAERVPVQFKRLPAAVEPGDRIMLDDGLLDLVVESKDEANVNCRIVTGGVLTSNKGINLPKASFSIASITEKDKEDLSFALSQRVDWIALSFVRRADDVHELRNLIRQQAEFGRLTPDHRQDRKAGGGREHRGDRRCSRWHHGCPRRPGH